MDLKKLFEIQAGLEYHITKEHPVKEGEDRLAGKILALQVELGECANQWRGFKFWSNNQEPRVKGYKATASGIVETRPLLEEYADCLHLILSIGIDLNIRAILPSKNPTETNLIDLFNLLFEHISFLRDKECQIIEFYSMVFEELITLGELLGFTWDEIEAAYLEKNKVNHERQATGY